MLKLIAGGFAFLRRSENVAEVPGGRMKRLAQGIEALVDKDERLLSLSRQMDQVRRAAACDLHTICRDFVNSLNRLMSRTELLLDPAEFSATSFQEDATNLIQISVRGRILQVAYAATQELISTEDFRVPYTLAGSLRAFNQDMLTKDLIEEQLVFYTVEGDRKMWRFFDARTYRSGTFDQEFLVSVVEQLI
jgi:hypothetical protein